MGVLDMTFIETVSTLTVVWICFFFFVSYVLPNHPDVQDFGMLVRKVVRLFNALLILPLVTHQLFLLVSDQGYDFEWQIFINLVEISFYLADAFWIFIWQNLRENDMIFHHIVGIGILSAGVYLRAGQKESIFEFFAVEQSAFFSMLREILKSYKQQNTKSAILIDFIYTLSFFCTKIAMRMVLIYFYVYKWDSSAVLIYINYFIQALYFYWGYNLMKGNYSRWLNGYFSYKNFEASPWLISLKKQS